MCWKRTVPRATPFWYSDAIGHADIAVACVLRFTREAHPSMFDQAGQH